MANTKLFTSALTALVAGALVLPVAGDAQPEPASPGATALEHVDDNLDNAAGDPAGTPGAVRYNWPTKRYGMESVVCAPAGTQRFQALYAYPSGSPNNLDGTYGTNTLRAQIQQAVRGASGNLNAEVQARSETVGARLRVACTGDGTNIEVTPVQLNSDRSTVTSEIAAQELGALGYADPNTKYVVYADFCRTQPETEDFCDGGQVKGPDGGPAVTDDDTPSATNPNFTSHDYAFQFCACSNGGVLKPPTYTGGTMLHEMVHTLGFVQPSAPKSTGSRHHCYQYSDLMCYDDGGPNSELYHGNRDCSEFRRIDCGTDDYMDPHPPEGSYLATKLNLAAAYVPFVDHSPTADITSPFRVVDLRPAVVSSTSVSLAWSRPVDKRGIAGMRIYGRTAGYSGYSLISTPTGARIGFTVNGLSPDTTYQFYVSSFDAAGNLSARSNILTVTTPS